MYGSGAAISSGAYAASAAIIPGAAVPPGDAFLHPVVKQTATTPQNNARAFIGPPNAPRAEPLTRKNPGCRGSPGQVEMRVYVYSAEPVSSNEELEA